MKKPHNRRLHDHCMDSIALRRGEVKEEKI